MAKTSENVKKFLEDLQKKHQFLWKDEKKTLLEMKEAESKELGLQFYGSLAIEDIR